MITLAIWTALIAGLAFVAAHYPTDASRTRAVEALCVKKLELVIRRAHNTPHPQPPGYHLADYLEKVGNAYMFQGVPLVAFGPMTRTSRFGRLKARYSVPVTLPSFPGVFDLEVLA